MFSPTGHINDVYKPLRLIFFLFMLCLHLYLYDNLRTLFECLHHLWISDVPSYLGHATKESVEVEY